MSCYTTTTTTEESFDCPICMDAVDTKVNCVITECGHKFHTRCLLTNIVHNGFGCPYCRTEMIDVEEIEADEDEENDRNDTINNAFFLDEEEDDEDSWNPPEEEDEEDNTEQLEDYTLRGMRFMFAMFEGDATESNSESDSDSSSSDNSDSNSSDGDSSSAEDSTLVVRTDIRVSYYEQQEEENRMLESTLPSIPYIVSRFTSPAYGELSFEEISNGLMRIVIWNNFPEYDRIISNRIGDRLENNLDTTITQIIEGYRAFEHEALVEERRNRFIQAADMGMD